MHQSQRPGPQLLVVMPVFNEQEAVRRVVLEWFRELDDWTEDFIFLAIDDGSRDATAAVLHGLQRRLGPRLEVLSRPNRGHGQSCLQGYRIACERNIPWVLQIDSDGQCDPAFFHRFWRARRECDAIHGRRWRRDDGFGRMVASQVLRLTLLACARTWCVDANVPYRLMRTDRLRPLVDCIPADFFLANVALSVLLRWSGWSQRVVPIRFRDRYAGTPSVRLAKFGAKAVELVRQVRALRRAYRALPEEALTGTVVAGAVAPPERAIEPGRRSAA